MPFKLAVVPQHFQNQWSLNISILNKWKDNICAVHGLRCGWSVRVNNALSWPLWDPDCTRRERLQGLLYFVLSLKTTSDNLLARTVVTHRPETSIVAAVLMKALSSYQSHQCVNVHVRAHHKCEPRGGLNSKCEMCTCVSIKPIAEIKTKPCFARLWQRLCGHNQALVPCSAITTKRLIVKIKRHTRMISMTCASAQRQPFWWKPVC